MLQHLKPGTQSTLLRVLATNRQQLEFNSCHGRHCRQIGHFVADTVDYVASVYRAKATGSTLSTFNKVDRVEFNFVASVYQAL